MGEKERKPAGHMSEYDRQQFGVDECPCERCEEKRKEEEKRQEALELP